MGDMFEAYASEYEKKSLDLNVKISELSNVKGEKRKAKLQIVSKELDTLKSLISQLEVEYQTSPQSVKPKFRTRLSNYSKDFMSLEREFNNATSIGIIIDREELLGSKTTEDDVASDERTRLLVGTYRLEKASQSLAASKRVAAECEVIGQDIMTNLGQQRDTIERSTNMTRETNAELTRASKGISLMQRRAVTNKLIVAFVILGLLVAIGIIIWFKWLRRLFK
eukprot:GGOE01054151.1.p1 GENE.GGOE01054151.1~~GGOE01054151.1.p1  ORF type:complete len:224 (+),score=48.26 GGOE01054151.1:86-757(+)